MNETDKEKTLQSRIDQLNRFAELQRVASEARLTSELMEGQVTMQQMLLDCLALADAHKKSATDNVILEGVWDGQPATVEISNIYLNNNADNVSVNTRDHARVRVFADEEGTPADDRPIVCDISVGRGKTTEQLTASSGHYRWAVKHPGGNNPGIDWKVASGLIGENNRQPQGLLPEVRFAAETIRTLAQALTKQETK